jgi:hypothetical protein
MVQVRMPRGLALLVQSGDACPHHIADVTRVRLYPQEWSRNRERRDLSIGNHFPDKLGRKRALDVRLVQRHA